MCFNCIDVSEKLTFLNGQGLLGPPSGAGWRYVGQSYGMAVADIDGNGHLDLYVNHHYLSPAELIFDFATDAPRQRFVETLGGTRPNDQHGAVFFDIDQDGDLDLLETRGGDRDSVINPRNERQWNEVYINDGGDLVVDNQADEWGIEYGPSRGRMIVPINLDGRIGLYLGAAEKEDGTYPSKLMVMRSEGGSFRTSKALKADALAGYDTAVGVHIGGIDEMVDIVQVGRNSVAINLDVANGVGRGDRIVVDFGTLRVGDVNVADFDGDLEADLFVATDRGGRLLSLDGRTVTDLSREAGLTRHNVNLISSTAGDFDNDGDIDVIAVHRGRGVEVSRFANDGNGRFTHELLTTDATDSRAFQIISGDFNGDGALDVLIGDGYGEGPTNPNPNARARGEYILLEGQPNGNHWLSIDLTGTAPFNETSGLGARVFVKGADGRVQMQEQDSGVHKHAQDDAGLHFGLGARDGRALVTVMWADGHIQEVGRVAVDRRIDIVEARGTLFVERVGEVVTMTARAQDRVSLPGTVEVSGGRITDFEAIGLERKDDVDVGARQIEFEFNVSRRGSDSISFRVDENATLDIDGGFDLVYL